MIVSSAPGRIRIRHLRLRDPAWAEPAGRRLAALVGVEARLSPRVGSLLVTFDPARVSSERILAALELPKAPGNGEPPGGLGLRLRPLEAGLLGSLALTAAAGFLKVRWLHVAAGLVLVGFVGAHVARSRRPGRRTEGGAR